MQTLFKLDVRFAYCLNLKSYMLQLAQPRFSDERADGRADGRGDGRADGRTGGRRGERPSAAGGRTFERP